MGWKRCERTRQDISGLVFARGIGFGRGSRPRGRERVAGGWQEAGASWEGAVKPGMASQARKHATFGRPIAEVPAALLARRRRILRDTGFIVILPGER